MLKELEYPFDSELILKKSKKMKNHGLPGTNIKRAAGLNYELYCI